MLIDKYLQYIRSERGYSELTVLSYQTDLRQFEEYVEKKKSKTFDLTQTEAEDVRNWMVSLKLGGEKSSSINRKLSALRSFFKYLQKHDVVKKSPMSEILLAKKEKRLPSFLRENQMDDLLENLNDVFDDSFEGVRNKLIIEAFYTLGIRRAELISLKDENVNLSGNYLKVVGKGGKTRLIPFGERLKKSMQAYLQLRRETMRRTSVFFFQRATGEQMYPMLIHRIVNKYLKIVSSQTKTSPHVLRHTFATVMLNNGAEINAVKELLGHASLAATEVYTHTTFEELQKIYKQAHPRA